MAEHLLKNFVFFGSSYFSTIVLNELEKKGFTPSLVVTTPSKPSGRKMALHDPVVKTWAEKRNVPVIQPAKLDEPVINEIKSKKPNVSVVASYGKIMPTAILEVPKFGSFNIHPSLLPKYRGPSPLQSQIMAGEAKVGVTVIKMDDKVDHGPILANEEIDYGLDLSFHELGEKLFKIGTDLLASKLQNEGVPMTLGTQEDTNATFTHKFEKADGELDLSKPKTAWLKYLALGHSPGVYFTYKSKKDIKIKVIKAEYRDGRFMPIRVIPEAKKEMPFADFLRGQQ
jgi:methionyl-tRNA formyltransferase